MFAQTIVASLLALPFASAAIIDVFVGGLDATGATVLKFTPDSVTANVGDSVRFTFGAHNHSVMQSAFTSPCSPLAGGFFSGFMAVADTQTTDLPQFQIPVTSTKPIWAYCTQTGHCGKGMVFAINAPLPPAANTFPAFLAAAEASAPPTAAAAVVATPPPTASTAAGGSPYGSGSSNYGSDNAANGTASGSAATPASTGAATGTSSGSPTVHTVIVGGSAGLVYTPNIITAAPGDTVSFQFQVKNHTATQSTFAAPCTQKAGGFSSGFMPVAATATDFPVWNLLINDTTPIWGYCQQGDHCQSGMVFAINPVETGPNTFEAFKAAAATAVSGAAASTGSTPASSGSGYGSSSSGAGRLNAKFGVGTLLTLALGFAAIL